MVAVVLEQAGLDPSYLIGGDLNESGSGARSGSGELFVFEADESDGSFLLARPSIGVITNVEVDHVDFYPGGRDEIEAAFAVFADRCERVVACGDDEGATRRPCRVRGVRRHVRRRLAGRCPGHRVAPWGRRGHVARCALPGGREVPLALRIDGVHNLLNAAAAVLVAVELGVAPDDGRRGARCVRRRPPTVRVPRTGARCGLLRRLRAHAHRDGRDARRPRAGVAPGAADRARPAAPILARAGPLA